MSVICSKGAAITGIPSASLPLARSSVTFRIYCDVIDESGAIATVATILAVNAISIKNISIVHNRMYEQGALAIEFYEEAPMRKAVELLRHHRYTVEEND